MSLFNVDHRTSKLVLACAALVLGGAVVGAGCGGTDTSTVEGFCEAQAIADCSIPIVQACYGSSDATLNDDTTSCITRRTQSDKCNPSSLAYHADFADDCINMHATVFGGGGQIDRSAFDSVREACLPVFNRSGQQGSTCRADEDCNAGAKLRCITRSNNRGSCQVPQPVGGGSSCSDPAAQCPADQYCDAGSHCVQRAINGEACGISVPCGAGVRCNEVTQKCEPKYANGEACKVEGDCLGGFCLGIQLATGAAGQCAATYQFGFGSSTCVAFIK